MPIPQIIGGVRYLAVGLRMAARYAPAIQSAYGQLTKKEERYKPNEVVDPRSGIAVTREVANRLPHVNWHVPVNAPGVRVLRPEDDAAGNKPAELLSMSEEAITKAQELAPMIAKKMDAASGEINTIHTYQAGFGLREGVPTKESAKETERLRRLAAVMQDVAVATDIILKHDPAPGSLETRFLAEEQQNLVLSDGYMHEALRNLVLGTPATGKFALGPYRRGVYRDLYNTNDLGTVMLNSFDHPLAHFEANSLAWRGNGYPLHVLEKDPAYAVAIESLGYSPDLRVTTLPPGSKRYVASASRRYDADSCCPYQTVDANSPDGTFYKTPTFVARMGDLEPGVYGETRIDMLPFEIVINNRNVPDRSLVSFVHEALHGYDELHKLGIDHNQLHSLSVYLTQEAIPGYLALREFLNNDPS